MQWIKNIFNFYIDASIHVALAVYALIQVTCINFSIEFDKSLSYAIFFGVIVAYNFLKYAESAGRYIIVRNKKTRIKQGFSFLCGAFALFFALKLPFRTWILLGALTIVSALYLIPIRIFGKNIRSFTGLKVFVVALVWALVTVMLPVLDSRLPLTLDIGIEAVQRFLFIVAIMVPFEIRDLTMDADNLQTLPQVLGVQRAKILGIGIVLLFYLLDFFKVDMNTNAHLVLSVVAVVSIVFIHFSKEGQGKYYSAFWVEAIPLLWWVLLLFF